MGTVHVMPTSEEGAAVAAARAGDESAFAALTQRYRPELQVHCYRMLGSFEDAEDVVQETFLRAWRRRGTFEGRSSFRAWLYGIATHASLDAVAQKRRRATAGSEVLWLQPYPDRLLDAAAPREDEPDAVVVTKETIELAFLVAIQHLGPRQRAVLILRDVLGWSAKESATLLETTVDSVNSALRRARSTLKRNLPARRLEWAPGTDPTREERRLLRRYMDAHERRDATTFAALLREESRLTMPPTATWYDGREAIVTFHARQVFVPELQWRALVTRANRQPAVALYTRRPGEPEFHATVMDVLRIEDGLVAQIDSFILPSLFPAFGLPPTI
jgi:RNA polymerase sigma-70 factor (ECF subfamily)